MDDDKKMNKTTKKHFELFQKECNKWIEYFGLKQWRVFYEHDYVDDAYGSINAHHPGKVVTITLSKSWEETKPNNKYIKRTAFHEICELLISPLERLAKSRFGVLEEEIQEEIHNIIRTLENTVWKEKILI